MFHRTLCLALVWIPVAVAPACQCGLEPLAARPGTLDAIVCDEESGFPIRNGDVTLEIDGVTTRGQTDDQGHVVLTDLAPGQGELVFFDELGDRSVEVLLESGDVTLFRDAACRGLPGEPGTGGVRGQVCNKHTGEVITDAVIVLDVSGDDPMMTETDEDGLYAFSGAPEGEGVLTITGTGFTQSLAVEIVDGEVVELGLEDCRAPTANEGFLIGAACDPDGGPLVGAEVSATDDDGNEVTTVTDINGAFLLGPMAAGPTTVTIDLPGGDLELDVEVVAGVDTDILPAGDCPAEGGEGEGEIVGEGEGEVVGEGEGEAPDTETGSVRGRVCAPDGETWLSGAEISVILADGTVIDTTTDGNGRWRLNGLPQGPVVIDIRSGSFDTTITVEVVADTVVTLPEEDCELVDEDIRIAVVAGEWDRVRDVLVNVGVDEGVISDYASSWSPSLLNDYETLASYDIVFINCGAEEFDYVGTSIQRDNLRQYVRNGGSLYASDLAYDVVEMIFPSAIEFWGDDSVNDSAQTGAVGSYSGTVLDSSLSAGLGTTSIQLNYPLPVWAVMEGVGVGTTIHISGDADVEELFETTSLSNVPHTVSFEAGAGKVVFSSFHQEPGVNVQQEQVLRMLMFQL
jgi:hypothetical protein